MCGHVEACIGDDSNRLGNGSAKIKVEFPVIMPLEALKWNGCVERLINAIFEHDWTGF
jgi:hypothetical protein